MLGIYDITKFTMLDYPNKLSCIIWFSGCDYNCKYCYNQSIIENVCYNIKEEEVIEFLKSRVGKLEGVVLSGGECTTYGNDLIPLIKSIKELGFKIKIDTNGNNTYIIYKLIQMDLIDYIAIDYKSSQDNYKKVTGGGDIDNLYRTLDVLKRHDVKYEIRTTTYADIVDSDNIKEIILDIYNKQLLKEGDVYYIQAEYDKQDINLKNDIIKFKNNHNFNFDIEFRNF